MQESTVAEFSAALQYPRCGHARTPPGHIAPLGHARHAPPLPNAQREKAGSDVLVHAPVLGSVNRPESEQLAEKNMPDDEAMAEMRAAVTPVLPVAAKSTATAACIEASKLAGTNAAAVASLVATARGKTPPPTAAEQNGGHDSEAPSTRPVARSTNGGF